VENERVGVRCGVLDQASIVLAERDALTLIDCARETHARDKLGAERDEDEEALANEKKVDPPFRILLAFSGLREALTSTGYNARVEECREAARRLLRAPGASDAVLGDVSPDTHAREKTRLPAHLARRAAHFFGEAKRVADGELLWRRGDLRAFGALVTESGVSSVENYECGCAPMNALRAIVCATRGVFGARFSGAGFRGCVVGLVDAAEAEAAAKSVREAYSAAFPELAGDARVELAGTGDGARIIERDDSDT
jgi:galactokinase